MKFLAEIVELKQVKNVMNDQIVTIKLRTDNKDVLALAAVPGDSLVEVEVKPEEV